MDLTVLGCDGSYAGPGGACSGYLVRAGGTAVWIDCGPGTMANVQRHVAFAELDALVVSHSHPDHWVELPVLLNALRYYAERPELPVYGTAATRQLLGAITDGATLEPTLRWTTITAASSFEVGPLRFTTATTDHPVETMAIRVDDAESGRSMAYTADTGPGWSLTALGRDLDLALCEATLPPDLAGQAPHLTAGQAGAMAGAAGAAHLVLTHLAPGSDGDAARTQAAETFGGAIDVATVDAGFDI